MKNKGNSGVSALNRLRNSILLPGTVLALAWAIPLPPAFAGETPPLATTTSTPKDFLIASQGLKAQFTLKDGKFLRLVSILPDGYVPENKLPKPGSDSGNEVMLQCLGENQDSHHGTKLTGGNPGGRLEFVGREETDLPNGKKIVLTQRDPVKKLKVESVYELNNAAPILRRYTRVTNEGTENVGIEYLSSAILNHYSEITAGSPEENIRIHYAFNSWMSEGQWHKAKPSELGWNDNSHYNLTGAAISSIGSWSTIKYLPMGMIENVKAGIIWFWQIEHNGSWYAEMANASDCSTYLYLGGPDSIHSQAFKNLKPGESYQTVPVALGCVKGGFDQAVAALTQYRRTLLPPHASLKTCPVIFNDYMECLVGNPTSEAELPLIDAAAKMHCQYFVIDAGWYAEKKETWWDAVGLWQPSRTRFDGGLESLLAKIKAKGLIPGLWVEPEVAGIKSPLKDKPDNWFLLQNGKRVIDHGRYLLDFRNPEVVAYMSSVVDRLVNQYGAGYLKMDYNNTVWGADAEAGSGLGQGLLEHNRAVVKWYKSMGELHPGLVIENCASGGCRMDYAMLSVTQIQSSSDQSHYKLYPAIITGAMAAVVPEQLAAWSVPLASGNAKEASFNMVNAMLCRIHLSGNLATLPKESRDQVEEGIALYQSTLSKVIPKSVPFFPLGMPSMTDSLSPVSLGIRSENKEYIAVWRLAGESTVNVPLSSEGKVSLFYPRNLGIKLASNRKGVRVDFPDQFMAAIVEVTTHNYPTKVTTP